MPTMAAMDAMDSRIAKLPDKKSRRRECKDIEIYKEK